MNRFFDLLTGNSFRSYLNSYKHQKKIPGRASQMLQDRLMDSMVQELPKVLATQAAVGIPIIGGGVAGLTAYGVHKYKED